MTTTAEALFTTGTGLDKLVSDGGFRPGMIVIGGATNVGKSTVGRAIVSQGFLKKEIPASIIDMESNLNTICHRIVHSLYGELKGETSTKQLSLQMIGPGQIECPLTLESLNAAVAKSGFQPKVILLDGFNEKTIGDISDVKLFSMQHKCLVIVTWPLNAEGTLQSHMIDGKAELIHLKHSGRIYQFADYVVLLQQTYIDRSNGHILARIAKDRYRFPELVDLGLADSIHLKVDYARGIVE